VLHVLQDRSLFPVMLCATRLSGVGADMLFMGLIRHMVPASYNGRAVVRFWTNSAGIILCCDHSTADSFGLDAAEVVGQAFGNLCSDVEGVNGWVCFLPACRAPILLPCCMNLTALLVFCHMPYATCWLVVLQSFLHTLCPHYTMTERMNVACPCVGSLAGDPRRGMMGSQLVVLQRCPGCVPRSCTATCPLWLLSSAWSLEELCMDRVTDAAYASR
jgi:hypothetical protein